MNNLFMFFSLFTLFIFIFFLHKFLSSSPKNGKNTPPSLPKLPLIGNIHQLGSLPHRYLTELSKRYGPLMLIHFGSVPVLVATSPEAAKEIMKDHDAIFSDRPKSSIPERLIYGSKDVAFAPYGKYWQQMRSICVLHLLSNKRVHSFRNVREEETRLMVEKIRQSSGSPINLSMVLIEFTKNVICRVALGRKYGDEEERHGKRDFKSLLGELFQFLGTFVIGDYIPWLAWVNKINGFDDRVEKLAKELDEFFENVVQEHIILNQKAEDGSDLVDIMLDIQRENKMGFPLQKDSIKALITDMFGAGTHTIYTVLEWTIAELIKNPEAMKRLQSEVRANKYQPNEALVESNKMQYLKAVIKESLRLHMPVPLLVPRKATKDVKVMGFDVAAGTEVLINCWAIARDPKIWDDPEEFKPERFLNSNMDYIGTHLEFLPFGAGRRGCPGVTFAVAAVELALATLVWEFDFSSGTEDLNMDEKHGIVVAKKTPLVVNAIDVWQ